MLLDCFISQNGVHGIDDPTGIQNNPMRYITLVLIMYDGAEIMQVLTEV